MWSLGVWDWWSGTPWRTMEDRSASGRRHMDPFGHGLRIGLWMIGSVESGSTFPTIPQIHDAVEISRGNFQLWDDVQLFWKLWTKRLVKRRWSYKVRITMYIQLFRGRLSEKCARDNPERWYGIRSIHCFWHCSFRTCFCYFPLALTNKRPWPLVPFFQISLKNSKLKTTHNTFRDCRVHFFRQPFSK